MAKTGTPTELGTQPIGNMVDSIFIGHGVGPLAISGLAITFPLMNLAAAFGSLVGVGASTLVSVKLGQKDYATAQNILGNVVTLNFIIGIGFSILTLLFLDPILYFFGASHLLCTRLHGHYPAGQCYNPYVFGTECLTTRFGASTKSNDSHHHHSNYQYHP